MDESVGRKLKTALFLHRKRAHALTALIASDPPGSGTTDKTVFTKFIFGAAVSIIALTGVLMGTPARAFSTGFSLVTFTTPVKAVALLKGATLTFGSTTVALAGSARESERLPGAILTQKSALSGVSRESGRVRAATLTGKVALLGTARESERVRGAALTGKTRVQGVSRESARLRGAALGGKTALSGTSREHERLTGQIQFVGTTTALAGQSRHTASVSAAGISLIHRATPVRHHERLRGATLTGKVPLLGTARESEGVRGAALGFSSGATALAGTARSTDRLTGATLIQKVKLTGTVREAERLRGAALTGKTRVQGVSRESARLRGATLTQRVALVGTVRATQPRAFALLTPPLQNVVDVILHIQPMTDRYLSICPQVERDLSICPQVERDLSIRPQVERDLSIHTRVDRDLFI